MPIGERQRDERRTSHLSFGDKRAGAGPNVTDLTVPIVVISNRRSLQILSRLFPQKTKNQKLRISTLKREKKIHN